MTRDDPLQQFRTWLAAAREAAGDSEPTAMVLATATPDGAPSARVVLLKDLDARGFVFFTNYDSRKARELLANPRAALAFHWHTLRRQVRVEGRVERVEDAVSDAYFATRPIESRLGAWASPQSEPIEDRAWLEQRVRERIAMYRHGEVPRPPFWGGFRLLPGVIEFWESRPDRLHERTRYTRAGPGWRAELLAP
jgi:pyridoxamine 5'-phosphate oxidase